MSLNGHLYKTDTSPFFDFLEDQPLSKTMPRASSKGVCLREIWLLCKWYVLCLYFQRNLAYQSIANRFSFYNLIGNCNFDSFTFCNWLQVSEPDDKFDWSLDRDSTPSSGTGPIKDVSEKGKVSSCSISSLCRVSVYKTNTFLFFFFNLFSLDHRWPTGQN